MNALARSFAKNFVAAGNSSIAERLAITIIPLAVVGVANWLI